MSGSIEVRSMPGNPYPTDDISYRICCMKCGKSVSSPVPKDTIVRAWVECPECLEKKYRDE